MRILIILFVALLLFSGCRAKKNSGRNLKALPKQENKVIAPNETILKEAPIVVKEEKVYAVDSAVSLPIDESYFVIMGSFKILENAKRSQSELLKKGFASQLLQNHEGLYRVSVFSYSEIEEARKKVFSIRKDYPEHNDVWLLRMKR